MNAEDQKRMYYGESAKIGRMDAAIMDAIRHPTNPMTADDLEALIRRRPEVYGRYAGLAKALREEPV